jgi:hypothetical protein
MDPVWVNTVSKRTVSMETETLASADVVKLSFLQEKNRKRISDGIKMMVFLMRSFKCTDCWLNYCMA